MQVFIGWDVRDDLAAKVCVNSLLKYGSASGEEILFLKDHELRRRGLYSREYSVLPSGQMVDKQDGRPFSTQFAFTRFLTPHLSNGGYSVFVDADFMFRASIHEMLREIDLSKTVSVVKHDHRPKEEIKMDGVSQAVYPRKNWSSLMVFNNEKARRCLSISDVNTMTGRDLHGLVWVNDSEIGEIDPAWNWLEGWSDPEIDPKAVHFTRGTPDMIGGGIPFSSEWQGYANYIA